MSDIDDLAGTLEEHFGVKEKAGGRSPLEQRVLAGFEEIERFFKRHNRLPQHGEGRDIFERLYAVRLDRLRAWADCRAILIDDRHGLLGEAPLADLSTPADVDELAASLSAYAPADDDLTRLIHVRSPEERKAAEEVAQRHPCADFSAFQPNFEQVQQELRSDVRQTAEFTNNGKIGPGDWFILGGLIVFVADAGELIDKNFDREDRRLRVIYDNGMESNLLMRSLQRAMYKDAANRRILPPDGEVAPLFARPSEGTK